MAELRPTPNLTQATPETGSRSSAEGSAPIGPPSRREPARLAVTPIHLQTLELHEPASKETVRAIQQLMSDSGSHKVFWDRCGRSDWLLGLLEYAFRHELLDARPLQVPLRRFACWCAREWQPTGTQLDAVLALAERACDTDVTVGELDRARRSTQPAASPAAVIGLPRCSVRAAAMLSAWHAANSDGLSAAIWAARFAALAAGFAVAQKNKDRLVWPPEGKANWSDGFHARCYADANPGVIAAAESVALRRQAHVLRFVLHNPFSETSAAWGRPRGVD